MVLISSVEFFQDLIKELQSELSGNIEELVMALFMDPTYYDAWTLQKAMSVCRNWNFCS